MVLINHVTTLIEAYLAAARLARAKVVVELPQKSAPPASRPLVFL